MSEYRVYVLRLQNQVWTKSKRFREENPGYNPKKRRPVVYVGSTGKTIDQRVADHLAGGRTSNIFVEEYFRRKMAYLYKNLPVFSDRPSAEALEAKTAKELRAKGWGVWGGKSTEGIGSD